jgi:DNA-binding SARP family transcriptional activator
LLHEALELWRGPPLAEFADEPFAQLEAGRLDDLRLAALVERIEADLALGRHANLIGELEILTREHPHNERLRAQLMLALYRSSRQADALAAYRDARAALDELGIEPGQKLKELERQVLAQEASLDLVPQRLVARGRVPLPGPLIPTSPFPFVGRASEVARLQVLLERAEGGEGSCAS